MLTTEDRLAIQDLYHRLCVYNDLDDVEGWVNCFTEDGAYFVHSETRGRANLAAEAAERWRERRDHPYSNSQHWIGNLIVEGDATQASGFCYVVRMGRWKDTGEFKIITQCAYTDQLAKVGGRWLLKFRRISFGPPPPDSVPKPA